MTAAALAVYGVLLAAGVVAVLRRPAVALYLFVLGLPLHNIVMSLLYGGGVRGGALDAIQAWKEILLAAALRLGRRDGRAPAVVCRSGRCSSTGSRSPSPPLVLLYAVLPQSALDGHAGAKAVLYGAPPRPGARRRLLPRPLDSARHPPGCAG